MEQYLPDPAGLTCNDIKLYIHTYSLMKDECERKIKECLFLIHHMSYADAFIDRQVEIVKKEGKTKLVLEEKIKKAKVKLEQYQKLHHTELEEQINNYFESKSKCELH